MKINMRTVQQALNIGQRVYREWNKYQNKKARQSAKEQPQSSSRPAGYTSPGTSEGKFGAFGSDSQPASSEQSTAAAQTPTFNNPYSKSSQPAGGQTGSWQNGGYPGDYFGSVAFDYSPSLDGDADPGEVVWAWVPFEEDYSQGKDRPVVVIGRENDYLLALMLTSKDHTNQVSQDPNYLDIGSGVWDREGRASEVKLDRVIRLRTDGIRREGAIMPQQTFENIAQAYRGR